MSARELPARPNLDHLKNEAKLLRQAFLRADAAAVDRITAVIGPRSELKLTDAQRVIAREYGFPTWAKLRSHVQAARGLDAAIDAFLDAVMALDAARALDVVRTEPRVATQSIHVAAVLGLSAQVKQIIAADPSNVYLRRGNPSGEPLLWLCYSPFHGESAERDDGLAAAARTLLDNGANPNAGDGKFDIAGLYAVTGVHNVPRIATILLEAGANPNDGESAFHAAERYHVEALELLLRYGVDLNFKGEWGNTPLYFVLRNWDVARHDRAMRGVLWLLDHGADPNVLCGKEQESSLHVAVRVGQSRAIVQLLLDHGADVQAVRGDGRSAWTLAARAGHVELRLLLENSGALPEPLTETDTLMAACGRGDAATAARLASPGVIASLSTEDLKLLVDAAAKGKHAVVAACIAAGFPVDMLDDAGATALHHACISGRTSIVRELLRQGADFRIRDREHNSTAMGWACFGADEVADPEGEYEECVRALLEAGAAPPIEEHEPQHAGVAAVLRLHAAG